MPVVRRWEYLPSLLLLLAPVLAAVAAIVFIWRQARPFEPDTWTTVGILLAVGIALSVWQVVRLFRPLRALTAATQRVSAGEDVSSLLLAAAGPLAQLASEFKRMSSAVARREGEMQAAFERVSTVLGAMLDGVLAVDERQRILFANRAAGKMLDFDVAHASGKPLMEITSNQMLQEAVTEALASHDGAGAEIRYYEFTVPQHHGQTMAFRATRLPGEPCLGVVLVMQDVSELRRLETLRQEFVANVSHELKTPLTAIKAYTETLLDGAVDDAHINRDFLQRIDTESDRLYQLILDMLRLAQIESGHGQFEVSTVLVSQAATECIRRCQTTAQRKNITLTQQASAADLAVRADQDGLREVLENLIDNAIKYTDAGGNVSLDWREEDGQVVIDVSDDGIGIPADDQARVFERFYRVDKARSRELGSTGLGLSIVKHLVQTFGGTVSLTSQSGSGSTFTVRLPAAAAQLPA